MRFWGSYDWQVGTEMNELEMLYRERYLKGNSYDYELPHAYNKSIDVIDHADVKSGTLLKSDFLNENTFFDSGLDVEIYRHIRYLPAFWHSHEFLEIACVIQGNAVNYIGSNAIHMVEGDVLILAPEIEHALGVFDEETVIMNILIRTSSFENAFFEILSEEDILADFFRRMLYHSPNHPYLYFKAGRDHELFNFVGYALEEFQGKRQYRERMLNGIMTGFFITLIRKHGAEVILPDFHTGGKNENVVFILKYMQENYQTVTLSGLASFFNYSERQMQRIIKDATGASFRENLLKIKMIHAAKLLTYSRLPIGRITEMLNYESVANFGSAFKKYYGISPAEYRKRQ